MSEYIVEFGYEPTPMNTPDLPIGEKIIRCRDCRFSTITVFGECKYCEKFWLPDIDGYGADPQVYLPGDFFCGWGEKRDK